MIISTPEALAVCTLPEILLPQAYTKCRSKVPVLPM